MLTYDLDKREKLSLYEYLYRCIRTDILTGRIKAGEKLPSKRELAKHHDISVKTAENTYAQLLVEGYIQAREKRGYFAAGVEETGSSVRQPAVFPAAFNEEEYFADFTANNTVYEKFPFSMWSKVMRQTLSMQDTALLKTVPFNGVEQLRTAIAGYLYQFRGMNVSPDQIVIGAGTEYLYSRLLQLLGQERTYAMEDPGYNKIGRIYDSHGVNWHCVDIGKDGIDIEGLEACGAQVVHVSPGHHFPLGYVMPVTGRQKLLKWSAEERNRYIIEDDYDCEFRYTGRPIPAIQSMDRNHRVIYMNTFSKTLAPSIRISYMVLPEKLMEKYIQTMNFYSCTVSGLEQHALARFITEGYFERHLRRMKNYYKGHRDRIIDILLSSSLGAVSEILEDNAGTHLLLKVRTDMNDIQLKWAAREAGINIACLSEYCRNKKAEREHTVIINYSDMDEKKLKEAVKRLERILIPD